MELKNRSVVCIHGTKEKGSKLKNSLAEAGYSPVLSRSGEDGLDQSLIILPAVIIATYNICASVKGNIIHLIKENPQTKHIQIIVLLDKKDNEKEKIAYGFGADCVLADPPIDTLLAAVSSRLDSRDFIDDILEFKREYVESNLEVAVLNDQVDELNKFKEGVIEQLGDSKKGYIGKIIHYVKSLEETDNMGQNEASRAALGNLSQVANEVKRIFNPYDFYSKARESIQGRKILVIMDSKRDRKAIARAIRGTGSYVDIGGSKEEANGFMDERKFDLVISDLANVDVFADVIKKLPKAKTILMTNQKIFTRDNEIFRKKYLDRDLIHNIIAKDYDLTVTMLQEIVITAGKLLTEDIFGLEKYLSWGSKVIEKKINDSAQKSKIIKEVSDYVNHLGCGRSVSQNIEVLLDELLMNALYDAPVDKEGNLRFHHLDRRQKVILHPSEAATIRYASDGSQLALSVSDPFGRLERKHVYKYLEKCFAQGDNQIDEKKGGAGLGLYMIYRVANTFVINVENNMQTEVIGMIDLLKRPKETRSQTRSFHYFSLRK